MPCMGPNCDYAHKKGCEVGEQLLVTLIKEHKLLDIDQPHLNNFFTLPLAKERWVAAKKAFVEAVGELFVEDACNGF